MRGTPASRLPVLLAAATLLGGCGSSPADPGPDAWLRASGPGVALEYQAADEGIASSMLDRAVSGRAAASAFLGVDYTADVTVRLFPTAESFAAEWSRATGSAPECWMIANGSAQRVVMLSPRLWSTAACGHDGGSAAYVRGVTTHELAHALHHQHNPDPLRLQRDAEWFEEGLAVLAAGQLDAAARASVRALVQGGFVPATLRQAWEGSGGLAYPVGGSLVHYVDVTYGRAGLRGLLGETSQAGLLGELSVSEAELLQGWRAFVAAY